MVEPDLRCLSNAVDDVAELIRGIRVVDSRCHQAGKNHGRRRGRGSTLDAIHLSQHPDTVELAMIEILGQLLLQLLRPRFKTPCRTVDLEQNRGREIAEDIVDLRMYG